MKKIVYLGAGVSTEFGVLHLLKNGYNPEDIIIIDKGESIYNRKPSETMCGAGGCGTFSDYKIVKSWSQGGIFTPDYVDLETANRLGDIFIEYVKEYHPEVDKIMYTEPTDEPQWLKESPFELKQSPVLHLGTDYGRKQVQNIFEYLDKMGVVQLYNTEVVDIDFNTKTIIIPNDEYGTDEIQYDKLILAGGKSGVDLLDKLIKKYNLETTPRAAQIGVRYETDGKYFDKLLEIAYDFKLYQKCNENVSIRSFCTNNISAFVAPELTYGNITFNGHALKDPNRFNGLTNFGIMMEIKNEINDPFTFCKELVSYFNNEGKGSCYSPTNRRPTQTDTGDELPCEYIELEKLKQGFGPYFQYLYNFIKDLNNTFGINDDYIIYVPEVKYLSNTLVINNDDFTLKNYRDIHIQGDQSVSRGIWVAAISGLYVAESLLK